MREGVKCQPNQNDQMSRWETEMSWLYSTSLKKKKNFSTCAFYFFIFFDKPIHALILYELTL